MSRALPFYSPTPRRLRRPNHPNLFLLGFSSKLILWLSSFYTRAGQGRAGQGRAGQGRAGQGRAGQAGQGRAGQGRAGQGRAGQGRAGQGRAGQGRAGVRALLGPKLGQLAALNLRYRARRGCYRPHGCGEAGKRIGSLCAIEVEGLKRRPRRWAAYALSLGFRV